MKPHAKTALFLALAIVGGIAAGLRCDASVTVETPTQINPRPAAYTVKAYTEGSDPFDAKERLWVNILERGFVFNFYIWDWATMEHEYQLGNSAFVTVCGPWCCKEEK